MKNIKITYFNWLEMSRHVEGDYIGNLVLTYAAFRGYNSILAEKSKYLREKLLIERRPLILFSKQLLSNTYKKRIISKYSCKDPQAYFINPAFLTARVAPKYKLQYLNLLSLRGLNKKEPYIPRFFVKNDYGDNPLLEQTKDIITFIPEKSLSQTRTMFNRRRQTENDFMD